MSETSKTKETTQIKMNTEAAMSGGKNKTANTNNSWSESKIDQMILLAILLFIDRVARNWYRIEAHGLCAKMGGSQSAIENQIRAHSEKKRTREKNGGVRRL